MASKKKKNEKKKHNDWNDRDEDEKKLQAIRITQPDEASDDDESSVLTRKPRAATIFDKLAALRSEDEKSDDDSSHSNENDFDLKNKTAQKKEVKKNEGNENKKPADLKSKETGKSKGKKGKKITKEDEELDAILADLEKPMEKTTGKIKKKGAKVMTTDELAGKTLEQNKETVERNTDKTTDSHEISDTADLVVDNAVIETDNQNISKKKDKKRKKKDADEKTKREEDGGKEFVTENFGKETSEERIPEEVLKEKLIEPGSSLHAVENYIAEKTPEDAEDLADDASDKKKAKKKKKEKEKKVKESDKKETKKRRHVDLIKQLLRERQEAEERLLQQQREEEERLAAIQKAKEEADRLAREKKEREKQRKKERDERLKAEGKYLTPAQKEKLRRQQALLNNENIILPAAFRQGGNDLAPTKRPVYAKKKPKKPLMKDVEEVSVLPSREISIEDSKLEKEVEEKEVKDAKLDDDIPESWDLVDDEEIVNEAITEKNKVSDDLLEIKANKDDGISSSNLSKISETQALLDQEAVDQDDESSEDSSEEEDEESSEEERSNRESKDQVQERVRARFKRRRELAEAKRSIDKLRAPVICVLGHVDTGKTKMLDTIRRTNVQDGEAGGITQQIGATQIPAAAIKERVKLVRDFNAENIKIPGFLVIDTPGHESFSNLRARGSSLCDYAILVVDIMHGIEQQTLESLKLLLKRRTPFVIALNKIDRLYEYASNPRKDVYQHLKSQPINTQLHFKELKEKVIVQFAEQGINVALAPENPDRSEYVSMVPTSAYLGDGIGNLMAYIVNDSETRLASQLSFSDELECFVMEVKSIPGLGTTIDVILVNGKLTVGDIIVLTGTDGAIITQIRELLMPQPLKEIRVKTAYEHFQSIQGAQGVKIMAKGLEKAVAGLPLFIAHKEDEIDVLKEDAEAQLANALMAIKKKPEGVYVQASTLGSLEALLDFLRTQKIPYSNVNIGPVHKKDVQKAAAMLERKEEYACILAFDVRVDREVEQFAANEGVHIFTADIIYHLEDNFLKYREELRLKYRRENEHLAIFPCKLRILPQHIFNARNPIVIGVSIEAGQLKRGTPLCVPSKDCIQLGTVASIERNHEQVELAKKGEEVCIKIENTTGDAPRLYGRHFDHTDILVSKITRETIDVCKNHFRNDLSLNDWQLIVELKKTFDIM